jgi:uncharacterized protein
MHKPRIAIIATGLLIVSTIISSVSFAQDQALIEAAKKGDLKQVETLLNKGVDVNTKDEFGWTPLIHAAGQGHLDVVRFLVERGAEINMRNYRGTTTAVFLAALRNYIEVAKWLQAHGAERTFEVAVRLGDVQEVQRFIKEGADPNDKSFFAEETALMIAAKQGNLYMVRLLIDKGARVNARGKDGWTGLIWAAHDGHLEVIKLLIEKGAKVNAKSKKGETSLINAATMGHLEVVRLLIDKGADVHAKTKDGDTALKLAEKGYTEIVDLLKAHGAKE